MTQKDWILNQLLKKKTVTPIDALKGCGCFRLGGRIYELRKEGYDIRNNGKTYAKYFLVMSGVRRVF